MKKCLVMSLLLVTILSFSLITFAEDRSVAISTKMDVDELMSLLKIQKVSIPIEFEPGQELYLQIDIYRNENPTLTSVKEIKKPIESKRIGAVIHDGPIESNFFECVWAFGSELLNLSTNELQIISFGISTAQFTYLEKIKLDQYMENIKIKLTQFVVAEKVVLKEDEPIPFAIFIGVGEEEKILGDLFDYDINTLARRHRLLIVLNLVILKNKD